MKIGWKLRKLWLFKAPHNTESQYRESQPRHMETALKGLILTVHNHRPFHFIRKWRTVTLEILPHPRPVYMYMFRPKCEIVHFMKWTTKLTISWNGWLTCPFREMVKLAVHFMKWIWNSLTISWNGQLNVRNFNFRTQLQKKD